MAMLRVPAQDISLTNEQAIRRFLDARGVMYDRWPLAPGVGSETSDAAILTAYDPWLTPLMQQGGYRTVDVITVTDHTPNVAALRDKFLREHTHTEDEVRMFVEGQGLFWFHVERPEEEVFSVRCEAGDLIAVPANTKHWFDLGRQPSVRAIRIFTGQAGWVPHYTDSGIEQRYQDDR